MIDESTPRWLAWAREIQALSQTGLTFSETEYHRQRYRRLMEIAAEIVGSHSDLASEPVLENFAVQPGYATPKVDVRGAVLRDGRILLVQERSDGRWCMPGGWADVGEGPSAVVVREVWEESGFQVKPTALIGVYDANRSGRPLSFYYAYKIVFLCDIIDGVARPSDETLAVDFFPFNDVPPLSAERTNERHLADVAAFIADRRRVTIFD
jgi:ADP-ribose pyrophosphatase YjhB (NUDIX family)